MNEETVIPHEAPLEGASPIPASFYWALWIPAFCAMIWGMMVVFRVKPGPFDN